MENWFLNNHIINILKVGLSGFAFLIILMSYLLLKAEQKRKDKARNNLLKSINNFTKLSILFVAIVGGFSILDYTMQSRQESAESKNCEEVLKRMVRLSSSPNHDVESLRMLIKRSVNECITEEEKFNN